MAGLKRRLEHLERQSGGRVEEAIKREVLSRLTDEELDACEAALERVEAGEDPTKDDRAVVARWQVVRNEVSAGL